MTTDKLDNLGWEEVGWRMEDNEGYQEIGDGGGEDNEGGMEDNEEGYGRHG